MIRIFIYLLMKMTIGTFFKVGSHFLPNEDMTEMFPFVFHFAVVGFG